MSTAVIKPPQTAITMNDTVKPELLSVSKRIAALPPEVQTLFANAENGTPDNISKAGCLALAQLGKEAWNAWREGFPVGGELPHPRNCADFSGVDFRKVPIDFSGFVFGDRASFMAAQWGDFSRFVGASWGAHANFQGAEWGRWANFQIAQWGGAANFTDAKWGADAYFMGGQWGSSADFSGTQWGNNANFQGSQWGDRACFKGACWYGVAGFQGAMWGAWADFSNTHWRGWVSFSGESWEKIRQQYLADEYFKKAKEWAAKRGLAPDGFQEIIFDGACFASGVNFSNRKFSKKARFNSSFDLEEKENTDIKQKACRAPEFHGCELHQDTSFDGATFPPATGSDEAARAYRTLKLAFSKQQALREEQRFFRLEMEEEALREQGLKRGLFWAYKHFSDYGFSVWRPLCWALGASAVMAMLYGLLSVLGNCLLADVATCHFAPDWLTFSLLQTLPVPGVDKMIEAAGKAFLPADDWWGLGVSVLVIFHKAVVIAALFLVGLALRNLFRLK